MAKRPKLARVNIDVPDEKWADLVQITGETEPRRVIEAAMRAYIEMLKNDEMETSDD